ncbi:MAG TPA: D-2-hydroxyacid dehydrogenase family protein [Acidimicrobiales bacterium]|nr:D-2-hydroxyacid dehydrogenase family protein [Acidimicrobiales bacterium]
MTRLAILDDYQNAAGRLVDWSQLGEAVEVVIFHERLVGDALIEALGGFDIIVVMRERTVFSKAVLERLPRLRFIATNGMANAAIDLVATKNLGILVSGTTSGLNSTVEMTWALILAAIKGVPRADASVRSGHWQGDLPRDLAGATLGLVGLGRLGSAMVPIAKAFALNVIAWSQNLTARRADEVGVEVVTKADLMQESDIISIHLRLSARTTGLIGRPEFALMRPHCVLVNTSRGPIVDEPAMIEALSRRQIGGAGLDVYDQEPVVPGHPLTKLENVVLSPHLGYASEANLRAYLTASLENVVAYLDGAPRQLLGGDAASP